MTTRNLLRSVTMQVAQQLPSKMLSPKGLAIQLSIAALASAIAPKPAHAVDPTASTIGGAIAGALIGKKMAGDSNSTQGKVLGAVLGGMAGNAMANAVNNNANQPQVVAQRTGDQIALTPYGYQVVGNSSVPQPVYGPATQNAPQPTGTSQTAGTIGGVIAGAAIGRAVSGDADKGRGGVIGAVLGGLAGNAIGKDMDRRSQQPQAVYGPSPSYGYSPQPRYNNAPVYGASAYPNAGGWYNSPSTPTVMVSNPLGAPLYYNPVPMQVERPANLPPDMFAKLTALYQTAADARMVTEKAHLDYQNQKIEQSLNPNNPSLASRTDELRNHGFQLLERMNLATSQAQNAKQTIRAAGYDTGTYFDRMDQMLTANMDRGNYKFIDANGMQRLNPLFSQSSNYQSYGTYQGAAQSQRANFAPAYAQQF